MIVLKECAHDLADAIYRLRGARHRWYCGGARARTALYEGLHVTVPCV